VFLGSVIIIIIIIIIIITTGVQLYKKQWYEHVPKSVETSQEGKVPYCGINKYKLTELSPTTNQTL